MRRLGAATLLVTLSACATVQGNVESNAPVAQSDTIRFSAGRCFGTCPVYSVTVEPDGSGVLLPDKYTAVPGETRFAVTPQQYRRLRDSLAPFRPKTGTERKIVPGSADCKRMATDMPGYRIAWTRAKQEPTHLDYYGGCHDPQHGRLRTAIAAIPKLLDIQKMLTPAPGKTGKE